MTPERLERIREMSVGTEQSYGVFALAEAYEAATASLTAEVERMRGENAAYERHAESRLAALADLKAAREECDKLRGEVDEAWRERDEACSRNGKLLARAESAEAELRLLRSGMEELLARAESAEASLAELEGLLRECRAVVGKVPWKDDRWGLLAIVDRIAAALRTEDTAGKGETKP